MLPRRATSRKQLEDSLALIARGAVKPVISLALPLQEAGRAHDLIEAGKTIGRVVLRPNG
jgi:NADPH:quinone reductase-like Zn-dependent oxidoreductase